jgi:hypothetical protein
MYSHFRVFLAKFIHGELFNLYLLWRENHSHLIERIIVSNLNLHVRSALLIQFNNAVYNILFNSCSTPVKRHWLKNSNLWTQIQNLSNKIVIKPLVPLLQQQLQMLLDPRKKHIPEKGRHSIHKNKTAIAFSTCL